MPRPAHPSVSLVLAIRACLGSGQPLARYLSVSAGFVTHLAAGRKQASDTLPA